MERYEELEMQVIAFEVDDVLIDNSVVAAGSGQGVPAGRQGGTTNNNGTATEGHN